MIEASNSLTIEEETRQSSSILNSYRLVCDKKLILQKLSYSFSLSGLTWAELMWNRVSYTYKFNRQVNLFIKLKFFSLFFK